MPTVIIEVFATPHCRRCQSAKRLVETVANEFANNAVQWQEVDVIAKIDHAVQLGVIATPAIAINGRLIFTSLPSKQKLKTAIIHSLQNTSTTD